jgi:hypothetical protein
MQLQSCLTGYLRIMVLLWIMGCSAFSHCWQPRWHPSAVNRKCGWLAKCEGPWLCYGLREIYAMSSHSSAFIPVLLCGDFCRCGTCSLPAPPCPPRAAVLFAWAVLDGRRSLAPHGTRGPDGGEGKAQQRRCSVKTSPCSSTHTNTHPRAGHGKIYSSYEMLRRSYGEATDSEPVPRSLPSRPAYTTAVSCN